MDKKFKKFVEKLKKIIQSKRNRAMRFKHNEERYEPSIEQIIMDELWEIRQELNKLAEEFLKQPREK